MPFALTTEQLKKELEDEKSSSDSEPEDEYGELLTEDVEDGLNNVLKAIKTGDKSLFDPNTKFFADPKEAPKKKSKADKPLYLKDYHRIALLDTGKKEAEEKEEEEEEEEKPKTYIEKQKKDKANLMSEINNAFGSEDENEDDEEFLKKKEKKESAEEEKADNLVLPDPSVSGGDQFLSEYMEKHAWIPDKKSKDLTADMEEDDAEFDAAAEQFENAYNFRYEDPNAAEIVSYARNQATMRRKKVNSRKRERQKEQDARKEEKEEVSKKLRQKKQKKVNVAMDRIKEIRAAVGDAVPDSVIEEVFGDMLLKDDFDPEEWDMKMSEVFEKYGDDEKPEVDIEEGEGNEGEGHEGQGDDSDEEVYEDAPSSKRAQKREEKHKQKQQKDQVKQIATKIVEKRAGDLLDEVEEERGRSQTQEVKFRYREVSPESFGLTTRDILFANDTDLNDYVGIKKFAPYRSTKAKQHDKKKYEKEKRLKEWRKKVFKSADGPKLDEEDVGEEVRKHKHKYNGHEGHKKKKQRKE